MTEKHGNRAAPRPMQPIVEAGEAAMKSGALKWVLIVDDEPDVLDSVAYLVRGFPHAPRIQVRTARSGPEAIELMARHVFDLIITDFGLGMMDGVRFLEIARQLEPGVPCVMMTGNPTGALERLETLQEENVLLLAKPFDPSVLAYHVMAALESGRLAVARKMVTERPATPGSAPPQAAEHRELRHP